MTDTRNHGCIDGCTLPPHSADQACVPFGVPTVLRRSSLEGEVQQSTVDFPWVKEGLSVGPDEVLVLAVQDHIEPRDLRHVTEHLNRILGPTRYVIVTGMGTRIAKVHKGVDDAVLRAPLPASDL